MKRALREIRDFFLGEGWGAVALVILTAAVGVVLHACASLISFSHEGVANAIRDFSKVLFAGVLIQVLTRTWLVKNTLQAFYDKLKIKDAINTSGLQDYWWFPDVPWRSLFESCREVQVVAISANTLFTDAAGVGVLRDFLRRKDTRLDVILANPTDDNLMNYYDEQFGHDSGYRKTRVESSVRELRESVKEAGAVDRVTVLYTSRVPKYSAYRFDDKYLFVPYSAMRRRGPERIPVFCFGSGSFVGNYLESDLSFLREDATRADAEPAQGGSQ